MSDEWLMLAISAEQVGEGRELNFNGLMRGKRTSQKKLP